MTIGYRYDLGCHLATNKLCRIEATRFTDGRIPIGFVKIERIASSWLGLIRAHKDSPYEEDGSLKPIYWALPRWWELNRNRSDATQQSDR